MKNLLLVTLLVSVLTACANPINRHTFQNYMAAGDQAAMRGDLLLAKQNYSRALANVRMGNLGPEAELVALFRYARILGNLCEYDEAEKSFIEANRLNEQLRGAGSQATYTTVIEIGQFDYDIGRTEKSISYFEKALAIAEKFGMGQTNAAAFADVYADYADALTKAGNGEKARAASAKAASFRAKAGAGKSEYTRYPKSCK